MKNTSPVFMVFHPLALISIIMLSICVGCQKADSPPNSNSEVGTSQKIMAGTQPTDEECQAFANSFIAALEVGDLNQINDLINWNAILDRAISGIPSKKSLVDGFRQGFLQSVKGPAGVAGQIIQQLQLGGEYTDLRIHDVNGEKRVLFRFLLGNDGGINYHDMILAKDQQGQVRAVDIYVFLSAEFMSQSFRRAFIPLAAEGSKSIFARLTQSENDFVKHIDKIHEMANLLRTGQYVGVDRIYRTLPESLQREKSILLIRMQAAVQVNEALYAESIDAFQRFHPQDACIDMMSIDNFLMKKQFAKAFECIDRLDDSVGGDPYLNVLRANAKLQQQENNEAKKYAKLAIEQEPGAFAGYQALINVSIADKNFDETVRLLEDVQTKFEIEFEDFTQIEEFSDFVKSPQYKKWIELR